MTVLVRRLRLAAGPDWRPVSAAFEHREPDCLADYQNYFGRRVTFNARRYEIVIDATALAKPMPQVVEGIFESVSELGNQALKKVRAEEDTAKLVREAITAKVRDAITSRLAQDSKLDLTHISQALQMTPRTLQRRLEQQQTTFERILVETRKELAEQLLRDTDLTMIDIANRLGFSEASAFTRAVGSWFGDNPSSIRRRLRGKS